MLSKDLYPSAWRIRKALAPWLTIIMAAVELLLAGVPIERVSVLLGHQSVRVTERHYNPWVRSRQGQLEADVASAWKLDPVLDNKNLGTNQVHLGKESVN